MKNSKNWQICKKLTKKRTKNAPKMHTIQKTKQTFKILEKNNKK